MFEDSLIVSLEVLEGCKKLSEYIEDGTSLGRTGVGFLLIGVYLRGVAHEDDRSVFVVSIEALRLV